MNMEVENGFGGGLGMGESLRVKGLAVDVWGLGVAMKARAIPLRCALLIDVFMLCIRGLPYT
jgi:hypothetical protein